jgi:MFS family permease
MFAQGAALAPYESPDEGAEPEMAALPDARDSARTGRQARLIGGMIAAKICCMTGSAAFASTLVELSRLWRLDATRAGWIGSAYLIGYAVAAPLLVGMTDRIDARAIFLFGGAIGAVAFASFALFAHGMWSAFIFQAMAGVALAGAYMPGLPVLTQRLTAAASIRAAPYYTGAFGVGTAASFLISGWAAARYGWRATFVAGAAGSIAGAILMALAAWNIPHAPDFSPASSSRHPLDFRPVLLNRAVLAYIFAYGGHCWELFAFRAWLPAFLLLAWERSNSGDPGLAIARWSMLIVLIGVPSSIIGAELAHRWSRNRLLR